MLSIAKGVGGKAVRSRTGPACEPLEDRRLMAAGPGYLLSGNQWANPAHITFSFPQDGVMWDEAPNNLNASFNARFGGTAWQDQIARALQTWASVANLNFVRVGDSPLPFNVPGQVQGDPRFGDIRVGGFDFHDPSTLAQTYFPPPDGLTAAGDSEINTAQPWNIGSLWDLYSVELHEMGLALGLAETPVVGPVMNANYHGTLTGLTAPDIAGIQAIYGARVPDAYQAHGAGTSAGSAIDLTPGLNASGQETVGALSLATIGDTEYFRVVAPAGATGLQVTAIAKNVSLLSPAIRILDAGQATLAAGGNAANYGGNAAASLAHPIPGQAYEIAVTGATRDVFAVGAYNLNVSFSVPTPASPPTFTAPTPRPPAPIVTVPITHPAPPPVIIPAPIATPSPTPPPAPPAPPPPIPAPTVTPPPQPQAPTPTTKSPAPKPAIQPDRFHASNTLAKAVHLGPVLSETIRSLTIPSSRAVEFFRFQAARAGTYRVTAPGVALTIYNASGRLIGRAIGSIQFPGAKVGTTYFIEAAAVNGKTVASYNLRVAGLGLVKAATTVKQPAARPAATPAVQHTNPAAHPAGPAKPAKTVVPQARNWFSFA